MNDKFFYVLACIFGLLAPCLIILRFHTIVKLEKELGKLAQIYYPKLYNVLVPALVTLISWVWIFTH